MKPTIQIQPTHPMAGFTLIEVLIALLVSAVGLLGVAAMGMHALRSTMYSQFISDATMLAQDLESRCKLDRNHLYISDPTALPDYQDWLDHVHETLPGQTDPVVQRETGNCPAGNLRCFQVTLTWTAPANAPDDHNQGGPPTFTFTYPFAVIMPP